MWNLEPFERGTFVWNLEPFKSGTFMRNLGKSGSRFSAAAPNHPEARNFIGKTPNFSSCWGKHSIMMIHMFSNLLLRFTEYILSMGLSHGLRTLVEDVSEGFRCKHLLLIQSVICVCSVCSLPSFPADFWTCPKLGVVQVTPRPPKRQSKKQRAMVIWNQLPFKWFF